MAPHLLIRLEACRITRPLGALDGPAVNKLPPGDCWGCAEKLKAPPPVTPPPASLLFPLPPNANGAGVWDGVAVAGVPNMLFDEADDCWALNEKLVGATFCVFVVLAVLLPPNENVELLPVGCCAETPPKDIEPPKVGATV